MTVNIDSLWFTKGILPHSIIIFLFIFFRVGIRGEAPPLARGTFWFSFSGGVFDKNLKTLYFFFRLFAIFQSKCNGLLRLFNCFSFAGLRITNFTLSMLVQGLLPFPLLAWINNFINDFSSIYDSWEFFFFLLSFVSFIFYFSLLFIHF